MNDPTKLSRRDWFRLRVPHQNKSLGETAPISKALSDNGHPNDVLKKIDHPPNHDGLDLSKLPPMREAVLSSEQVASLFHDIEKLATDVVLMQRSTGAQRASAAAVNSTNQLQFAKTALLTNKVPRLQIRYRWENALWIDTLAAQSDGFRLVRIAHQG